MQAIFSHAMARLTGVLPPPPAARRRTHDRRASPDRTAWGPPRHEDRSGDDESDARFAIEVFLKIELIVRACRAALDDRSRWGAMAAPRRAEAPGHEAGRVSCYARSLAAGNCSRAHVKFRGGCRMVAPLPTYSLYKSSTSSAMSRTLVPARPCPPWER